MDAVKGGMLSVLASSGRPQGYDKAVLLPCCVQSSPIGFVAGARCRLGTRRIASMILDS